MRPQLRLVLILGLLAGPWAACIGQSGGSQPVIFQLKDGISDESIQGASFAIDCGDPLRSDHRVTMTDVFETIEYRPGTVIQYVIHRPGYQSESGQFTVEDLRSKNFVTVYLKPFKAPIRKTVQIEGIVTYLQDGHARLAQGVEVRIAGVANPKTVHTDALGVYSLSFEIEELVNQYQGYQIIVGENSDVFKGASRSLTDFDSQVFADFELEPYAANATLAFRLFDPRTRSNIPDAQIQVLVDGRVIAEDMTDAKGNVSIHPDINPTISRVTISIRKEGVLNANFKVAASEINSPYIIHQNLKGIFDRIVGSHRIQIAVGGSTAIFGKSKMMLVEAFTGLGRSTTMFGGISFTPNWVDTQFFQDSTPVLHPKETLSQFPVCLIYKQYLVPPAKLGANMFWGWYFSFRFRGPSDVTRFIIGEGAFVAFRYCFVKNFASEVRVCVNNSLWNVKDRNLWRTEAVLTPNFQFTFNYTLPQ